MSYTDFGHTGAFKQSWRTPSPRALLKDLMDKSGDPHNKKVLFTDFLSLALPQAARDVLNADDDGRLVAIIEYWFTHNYDSLLKAYPHPGSVERETARKQQAAARQDQLRTAVRERIEEKAQILLLEWIAPNGKAIGDCTGQEIRQLGRQMPAWLDKVAARVAPDQIVRDVISETEAREMWGK